MPHRKPRGPRAPERGERGDHGRFLKQEPHRHLDAIKLLYGRLGADTLGELLLANMKRGDHPGYLDLLADIEAAPLIPLDEVNEAVQGAHRGSLAGVGNTALSARMIAVLRELAGGATRAEIAQKLGISKGSVDTHLRRARIRLRARSDEHAIALALSSGMLAPVYRVAAEGRLVGDATDEGRLLICVARGETDREIAKKLGVSSETVKDRVDKLRAIFGARNRTELVSLAFATGRLRFVSSRHKSQS